MRLVKYFQNQDFEWDFHICTVLFYQQRIVFTNSTLFYQQHIILPTTHYFTNSTLFYQQRIVLPAAHCFTNSTLFYQQQVVLPTLIVLPTAHCFTNSTLFYQQHIVLPTAHYITNSTLFYQQHIILPTTTFDANFNSYSNIACINFMRTILGWDEPSQVDARVYGYHHVPLNVDLEHCNHRHDASYS